MSSSLKQAAHSFGVFTQEGVRVNIAETFSLKGEEASKVDCAQELHRFAHRDFAFTDVSELPFAIDSLPVANVAVLDKRLDMLKRFPHRLAVSEWVANVPNDGDIGVVGESDNISRVLGSTESVVGLQANEDIVA